MTLEEAYAKGYPLMFVSPVGGRRWIAALVVRPDAVAFADIGWNQDPPYHPFHVIRGRLTGEFPDWAIADSKIEFAPADEKMDALIGWQKTIGTSGLDIQKRAEKILLSIMKET